jgi:hypothetical protein
MSYVPDALRRQVMQRADERCEYCQIHQRDSMYTHEVDHIIPEKHRGQTTPDNLCLACLDCNRHKGSDFASFDSDTGNITPLFNPRQDAWAAHFRLEGARIVPQTAVGRVTVFVLQLNDELRLRARAALLDAGRYPLPEDDTP